MLRRFVSGAAVASVAIAIAAAVVLNVPSVNRERAFPLVVLWLCAPALWGVWAMLTPPGWMPRRLPAWGAVLGAIAAALGAVLLNLPLVVFGITVSVALRLLALPFAAAFYFLLWMIVRRVYEALQSEVSRQERAQAA